MGIEREELSVLSVCVRGGGRRMEGIEEGRQRAEGSGEGSSSPWLDACVCGGGQREREGEICVGVGIGRG